MGNIQNVNNQHNNKLFLTGRDKAIREKQCGYNTWTTF